MPLRYEQAIRDRLTDQVSGLRGVYGVPSGDAERLRPAPCAYVVFGGARVEESRAQGRQARVEATWEVVVAVRHVADVTDGQSARDTAQPLLADVSSALMGWTPETGKATTLRLAGVSAPVFESGLLLLGLQFTTNYVIGD